MRISSVIIKNVMLMCLVFVAPGAWAQVKVACVGNSITYGHGIQDREHDTYPAQLQRMLGEGFQVENFGVSGTTAQTKGDFPWVTTPEYPKSKAFMPDIVVMKLGTNDSKPQNWVSTEAFINDVEALACEFEALPSHPQIIISLPAKAYKVAWRIRDEIIRDGELKALKRLAKRHHWQLINMYKITSGMPERFPDGIHPDAQGAGVIATHVMKAVMKASSKVMKK